MMPHCLANGCRNHSGRSTSVTFHAFPRDASLAESWARRCGISVGEAQVFVQEVLGAQPEKHHLCSEHFEESMFESRQESWLLPTMEFHPEVPQRRLKPEAEPTLFGSVRPQAHTLENLQMLASDIQVKMTDNLWGQRESGKEVASSLPTSPCLRCCADLPHPQPLPNQLVGSLLKQERALCTETGPCLPAPCCAQQNMYPAPQPSVTQTILNFLENHNLTAKEIICAPSTSVCASETACYGLQPSLSQYIENLLEQYKKPNTEAAKSLCESPCSSPAGCGASQPLVNQIVLNFLEQGKTLSKEISPSPRTLQCTSRTGPGSPQPVVKQIVLIFLGQQRETATQCTLQTMGLGPSPLGEKPTGILLGQHPKLQEETAGSLCATGCPLHAVCHSPYPSARQEPITFDDIAVYFSKEEWDILENWQKEVYRDVMRENYDTLVSLGLPVPSPDVFLSVVERQKAPCSESPRYWGERDTLSWSSSGSSSFTGKDWELSARELVKTDHCCAEQTDEKFVLDHGATQSSTHIGALMKLVKEIPEFLLGSPPMISSPSSSPQSVGDMGRSHKPTSDIKLEVTPESEQAVGCAESMKESAVYVPSPSCTSDGTVLEEMECWRPETKAKRLHEGVKAEEKGTVLSTHVPCLGNHLMTSPGNSPSSTPSSVCSRDTEWRRPEAGSKRSHEEAGDPKGGAFYPSSLKDASMSATHLSDTSFRILTQRDGEVWRPEVAMKRMCAEEATVGSMYLHGTESYLQGMYGNKTSPSSNVKAPGDVMWKRPDMSSKRVYPEESSLGRSHLPDLVKCLQKVPVTISHPANLTTSNSGACSIEGGRECRRPELGVKRSCIEGLTAGSTHLHGLENCVKEIRIGRPVSSSVSMAPSAALEYKRPELARHMSSAEIATPVTPNRSHLPGLVNCLSKIPVNIPISASLAAKSMQEDSERGIPEAEAKERIPEGDITPGDIHLSGLGNCLKKIPATASIPPNVIFRPANIASQEHKEQRGPKTGINRLYPEGRSMRSSPPLNSERCMQNKTVRTPSPSSPAALDLANPITQGQQRPESGVKRSCAKEETAGGTEQHGLVTCPREVPGINPNPISKSPHGKTDARRPETGSKRVRAEETTTGHAPLHDLVNYLKKLIVSKSCSSHTSGNDTPACISGGGKGPRRPEMGMKRSHTEEVPDDRGNCSAKFLKEEASTEAEEGTRKTNGGKGRRILGDRLPQGSSRQATQGPEPTPEARENRMQEQHEKQILQEGKKLLEKKELWEGDKPQDKHSLPNTQQLENKNQQERRLLRKKASLQEAGPSQGNEDLQKTRQLQSKDRVQEEGQVREEGNLQEPKIMDNQEYVQKVVKVQGLETMQQMEQLQEAKKPQDQRNLQEAKKPQDQRNLQEAKKPQDQRNLQEAKKLQNWKSLKKTNQRQGVDEMQGKENPQEAKEHQDEEELQELEHLCEVDRLQEKETIQEVEKPRRKEELQGTDKLRNQGKGQATGQLQEAEKEHKAERLEDEENLQDTRQPQDKGKLLEAEHAQEENSLQEKDKVWGTRMPQKQEMRQREVRMPQGREVKRLQEQEKRKLQEQKTGKLQEKAKLQPWQRLPSWLDTPTSRGVEESDHSDEVTWLQDLTDSIIGSGDSVMSDDTSWSLENADSSYSALSGMERVVSDFAEAGSIGPFTVVNTPNTERVHETCGKRKCNRAEADETSFIPERTESTTRSWYLYPSEEISYLPEHDSSYSALSRMQKIVNEFADNGPLGQFSVINASATTHTQDTSVKNKGNRVKADLCHTSPRCSTGNDPQQRLHTPSVQCGHTAETIFLPEWTNATGLQKSFLSEDLSWSENVESSYSALSGMEKVVSDFAETGSISPLIVFNTPTSDRVQEANTRAESSLCQPSPRQAVSIASDLRHRQHNQTISYTHPEIVDSSYSALSGMEKVVNDFAETGSIGPFILVNKPASDRVQETSVKNKCETVEAGRKTFLPGQEREPTLQYIDLTEEEGRPCQTVKASTLSIKKRNPSVDDRKVGSSCDHDLGELCIDLTEEEEDMSCETGNAKPLTPAPANKERNSSSGGHIYPSDVSTQYIDLTKEDMESDPDRNKPLDPGPVDQDEQGSEYGISPVNKHLSGLEKLLQEMPMLVFEQPTSATSRSESRKTWQCKSSLTHETWENNREICKNGNSIPSQ